MGDETIIASQNGDFMAYIAKPSSARGPAVVCIQEIFGVNLWMRNIADDLADMGYVAIVPDLFWRIEPGVQINGETEEHFAKAFDLYGKFDADAGIIDIQQTINQARSMDENATQKVGTMGFCLGGFLAYLASVRTDADANVGYYGVGIENALAEKESMKSPLLLHVATADQFVPPNVQKQVRDGLESHPQVTIYDYDADHAFARKGGHSFVEKAASLAQTRTLDFFARHLS